MKVATYLLALALFVAMGLNWQTYSKLQVERLSHQTTKTVHVIAINKVLAVQHEMALNQIRETDRLLGVIQNLRNQSDAQKKTVAGFRASQLAATQRMRDQKADFDARVKAAGAEALRRYAKATDGDLERARADVERYGLEAVNCSIAAHELKGFQDAQP